MWKNISESPMRLKLKIVPVCDKINSWINFFHSADKHNSICSPKKLLFFNILDINIDRYNIDGYNSNFIIQVYDVNNRRLKSCKKAGNTAGQCLLYVHETTWHWKERTKITDEIIASVETRNGITFCNRFATGSFLSNEIHSDDRERNAHGD